MSSEIIAIDDIKQRARHAVMNGAPVTACPYPTDSTAEALWKMAHDLLSSQSSEQAAVRTLEQRGYTYHGGELWKPPLGSSSSTVANMSLPSSREAYEQWISGRFADEIDFLEVWEGGVSYGREWTLQIKEKDGAS